MESHTSCRCCLRRSPERDMTTPYTFLGKTEIYSDMLTECFDIELKLTSNGDSGICEVCVGRLRDARDFKLQVQHSQAELRARLQGTLQVKDEIRPKQESSDDNMEDDFIYDIAVPAKQELAEDATCSYSLLPTNMVESKSSQKPVTKTMQKKQSVKQERSHASQTCLATSRRGPRRASRMEDAPDDTAGLRAQARAYTCDTCGEHFTVKSKLLSHMKSHKVRVFSCDLCNKQFKHKCHLVDHIRIHTGEKPYNCETCGKSFNQISALVVHKRIHTGEKPYSCDMCNKRFVQISALYSHKLVHAAKAFTCDVCNKSFRHKNNFMSHKRIHTGEKPYRCEFCKKQFAEQSSLKRHKRIHTGETPYTCETCNMKFRDFSGFSRHKRTHTGEKPYTCGVCNKQFGRKTHLDRHKQIHTGVKPYCCEICGKQFSEKFTLNAHKIVHSKSKIPVDDG